MNIIRYRCLNTRARFLPESAQYQLMEGLSDPFRYSRMMTLRDTPYGAHLFLIENNLQSFTHAASVIHSLMAVKGSL